MEKDSTKLDKDLVCIDNDNYSIEIKTSSSKNSIFGNRSYGIQSNKENTKKKEGYYLAINFEKCTEEIEKPDIRLIRFGWLSHSDWISQTSETGQQASLSKDAYDYKLIELFKNKSFLKALIFMTLSPPSSSFSNKIVYFCIC